MKKFNDQLEQHSYYRPLQRHVRSVNTKTDRLYFNKRTEMEDLGAFLNDLYDNAVSCNESFSLKGVILA